MIASLKSAFHTEEKHEYRVMIIDDHPIVRQGLRQLINREADLLVCGEAEDATEALATLKTIMPDVALIDLSLKGINGIELIKTIKSLYPRLPMLVVSMHDEARYAERALRAGARGYVAKQERIEVILKAIRQVLRGDIYLSESMIPRVLTKMIDEPTEQGTGVAELLSDRELEIFQLVGQGLKTSQVADQLHLSIKTVESHCTHIKKKLQLRNAIELYQRAYEWVQSEGI